MEKRSGISIFIKYGAVVELVYLMVYYTNDLSLNPAEACSFIPQ